MKERKVLYELNWDERDREVLNEMKWDEEERVELNWESSYMN
jgi:hypothetical protein